MDFSFAGLSWEWWYWITFGAAIVAMFFTMFAQAKVHSTYRKYNEVDNEKGLTGAEVAKELLEASGVFGMEIEEIDGTLTDHYDPRSETIRLSRNVYNGKSLSSIGIAAHEAAHAIQHMEGYAPLAARQRFVGIASFGSRMAIPIVLLGLFFLASDALFHLGDFFINAGLVMFSVVVILQLITLPVEFNASGRALGILESRGILTPDEIHGAGRVLSAAAWTYIAATITAVITLIRLILIAKGRRR
ncbi:MAG: zinc metallopeptidase [Defluviitaleaceae bacterium]|nr:zinc metallopeptidase [Defluviitaleaceae bacterium]